MFEQHVLLSAFRFIARISLLTSFSCYEHLIVRHHSFAAAPPLRRVRCFSSAKSRCLQLDKAADGKQPAVK